MARYKSDGVSGSALKLRYSNQISRSCHTTINHASPSRAAVPSLWSTSSPRHVVSKSFDFEKKPLCLGVVPCPLAVRHVYSFVQFGVDRPPGFCLVFHIFDQFLKSLNIVFPGLSRHSTWTQCLRRQSVQISCCQPQYGHALFVGQ